MPVDVRIIRIRDFVQFAPQGRVRATVAHRGEMNNTGSPHGGIVSPNVMRYRGFILSTFRQNEVMDALAS